MSRPLPGEIRLSVRAARVKGSLLLILIQLALMCLFALVVDYDGAAHPWDARHVIIPANNRVEFGGQREEDSMLNKQYSSTVSPALLKKHVISNQLDFRFGSLCSVPANPRHVLRRLRFPDDVPEALQLQRRLFQLSDRGHRPPVGHPLSRILSPVGTRQDPHQHHQVNQILKIKVLFLYQSNDVQA